MLVEMLQGNIHQIQTGSTPVFQLEFPLRVLALEENEGKFVLLVEGGRFHYFLRVQT